MTEAPQAGFELLTLPWEMRTQCATHSPPQFTRTVNLTFVCSPTTKLEMNYMVIDLKKKKKDQNLCVKTRLTVMLEFWKMIYGIKYVVFINNLYVSMFFIIWIYYLPHKEQKIFQVPFSCSSIVMAFFCLKKMVMKRVSCSGFRLVPVSWRHCLGWLYRY